MAGTSKEWNGANSWTGARLEVTSSANTAGNYSTVTAKLYGRRNDGGTSYNASASSFWININGSQTSRTSGCTISGTGWQLVHSQSTNVAHNSDGSKSITVSAGGSITGTSFNMNSSSVSLTLDKIARKSSMSATGGDLGSAATLTVSRQNSSFTHTITASCGSVSETICTKSSETNISWTPSLAKWAPCNTTGKIVTITYTIETFDGSTSLGSNTASANYNIIAGSPIMETGACPIIEDFEVTDIKNYVYTQRKSSAKISAKATARYGATIKSVTFKCGSLTYVDTTESTSATYAYTFDSLGEVGSVNMGVTVLDSRGFTYGVSQTKTVTAYNGPSITALRIARCDSSGTESSSGKRFKAIFSSSATKLTNYTNYTKYTLTYRLSSQSTDTTTTLTGYADNFAVADGYVIFPNSDVDDAVTCTATITVTDAFESAYRTENGGIVGKVFSILSKGLGFAFGKVATLSNTLDVAWKTRHSGGLDYMVIPSGADLNKYTTANTYLMASGSTYSNAPVSEVNGILEVIGSINGALIQRYTQLNSTHTVYERVYDSSAWSTWAQDVSSLLSSIDSISSTLYHHRHSEINHLRTCVFTYVSNISGTSIQLKTIGELRTLFNDNSLTDTTCGACVMNGDGSATSIHWDNCTWLNDKLYATLASSRSGAVRTTGYYWAVGNTV